MNTQVRRCLAVLADAIQEEYENYGDFELDLKIEALTRLTSWFENFRPEDIEELVWPNYAEICSECLHWPDLQDGGTFERIIDWAINEIVQARGYKPLKELRELRK